MGFPRLVTRKKMPNFKNFLQFRLHTTTTEQTVLRNPQAEGERKETVVEPNAAFQNLYQF